MNSTKRKLYTTNTRRLLYPAPAQHQHTHLQDYKPAFTLHTSAAALLLLNRRPGALGRGTWDVRAKGHWAPSPAGHRRCASAMAKATTSAARRLSAAVNSSSYSVCGSWSSKRSSEPPMASASDLHCSPLTQCENGAEALEESASPPPRTPVATPDTEKIRERLVQFCLFASCLHGPLRS